MTHPEIHWWGSFFFLIPRHYFSTGVLVFLPLLARFGAPVYLPSFVNIIHISSHYMNIGLSQSFMEQSTCFGDCGMKVCLWYYGKWIIEVYIGQWMRLVKLKVRIMMTSFPFPIFRPCALLVLIQIRGWPRGVMVKAMDCEIVVSSNSSRAITFAFGQISLGKVWTPLSSQLWVK